MPDMQSLAVVTWRGTAALRRIWHLQPQCLFRFTIGQLQTLKLASAYLPPFLQGYSFQSWTSSYWSPYRWKSVALAGYTIAPSLGDKSRSCCLNHLSLSLSLSLSLRSPFRSLYIFLSPFLSQNKTKFLFMALGSPFATASTPLWDVASDLI